MTDYYLHFGKIRFFIASLPDAEWTYSYSAESLEKELNNLFAGNPVRAIYVGLDGYLESLQSRTDFIDLSYMGGTSLVVIGKEVLQLAIHAEGMIEYRHFPVWDMKMKQAYDYPPDDTALNGTYFFNVLDHDISFDYTGQQVTHVKVKGTDDWPFPQAGFDETIAVKAAERNDLPAEISFFTLSGTISFLGSDLEYYFVVFKSLLQA